MTDAWCHVTVSVSISNSTGDAQTNTSGTTVVIIVCHTCDLVEFIFIFCL